MSGRSKDRSRGVALITVIVVLLALVVIATPFSISMRNYDETSTDFLNRTRCRYENEALKNIAFETLKETHPHLDLETPLFDAPAEWAVDLRGQGLPFPTRDPRGRIWSAKAEDLQGRVNMNGASIYLIANLLDQRLRLAEDLEEGDVLVRTADTGSFPDEGRLWIEGEAVSYYDRTEEAFRDIERGGAIAGLERNLRSFHLNGAEILPFRAFCLATYCYGFVPGRFSLFPTEESVRNVAIYTDESLTREEYDGLEDLITVNSAFPGGRRFVDPQRILAFSDLPEAGAGIVVENGRYMGPGSIVRIRCEDEPFYSLVLKSEPVGERAWALALQDPLPFPADAHDSGVADVMARAPVNVNGASEAVLTVLLRGLSLSPAGKKWFQALSGDAIRVASSEEAPAKGLLSLFQSDGGEEAPVGFSPGGRAISLTEAKQIARDLKTRPIRDFVELDQRLSEIVESGASYLSEDQRRAVLLNALDANDAFVQGGTAPFCFASGGAFEVKTAVSDNYPASGREMARSFTRDVARVAPKGPLLSVFASQHDFEEARRLTREGRHYLTLPENLDGPDAGNLPPSSAPAILFKGRGPSEDAELGAFQLAPAREEGERCLHFDEMDRDYFLEDAVYFDLPTVDPEAPWIQPDALGFCTGENILFCRPDQAPVDILGDPEIPELEDRMWPFSVEMWYRFDEVGDEHFIFDCGREGEEICNRIYLFHDGKDLVFRVADVSLPTATPGSGEPLEHAEIRYDFSDLPLQTGVFYHIACMAAGTRPSDLCLFVDGVPRGKRAFQTRLTAPLSALDDQQTTVYTKKSSRTIAVEDATSFPSRGVLRVGRELIEYTSRSDREFYIDPEDRDPFGGRALRGGLEAIEAGEKDIGEESPNDHPETETIELYGYTCTLQSQRIPQGDRVLGQDMGRYWVATVSNEHANLPSHEILVDPAPFVGSGYKPFRVGVGFFTDEGTGVLPLASMNTDNLEEEGREAFSPTGGYGLVFSEFPVSGTLTFESQDNQASRTSPLNKGNTDVGRPSTPGGYYINRFSVFRYDRFDDDTLTGVKWWDASEEDGGFSKHRPRNFLQPTSETDSDGGKQIYDFTKRRCFVTRYDKSFPSGDVEYPRIFVIPLSINLATGDRPDLFDEYFSVVDEPTGGYKPEIVQVGTDFKEGEETEWIRYDSIDRDIFCRLNLTDGEVSNVWNYLSPKGMINKSDATKIEDEDVSDAVNQRVKFRAQHGTRHGPHPQTRSKVLPVFRVTVTGISRPGRNDPVTLVHFDPESDIEQEPEGAMINYSNCYGGTVYGDPYYGTVAMIGLREGVNGEFHARVVDELELMRRLMKRSLGDIKGLEDGAVAEAVSAALAFESRDFTRIVKFPSGELPSEAPDHFVIGGDVLGHPSPSPGCIDEVRFRSFETPHPKLPKIIRFLLAEDLEEDEKDLLYLCTDRVRFNRRILQDDILQAFLILQSLPEDAGYLLVGDELIAYTDVDVEEGVVTIAPGGRGALGTRPGHHTGHEPVLLLNFPELSILKEGVGANDGALLLEDGAGFPFEGTVLVDEEVIGYTRREDALLTMPEDETDSFRGRGVLRGRYGTDPWKHASGSVVYRLPSRYPDLFLSGVEAPEEAFFPLSLDAPGAYYTSLTWVEELCGPGADIVVRVQVGDRDGPKDVLLFEDPESAKNTNAILRQGDHLDMRVYTRYGQGAFDAVDFSSNAWKYSPKVKALAVEYLQPTLTFRHEEW